MAAAADPITEVYTDGACSGNPGPGGWAWVVPDGRWASGAEPHSTNQRMEVTAALEALRAVEGPVEVVSDSTYVVHCFRDGWWEGWLAKGWRNSKKEPVKNRDLWEPLIELVTERGDVTFRWVKAHAGDTWNDVADRLAVQAATEGTARTGTGMPTDLPPADEPRARPSAVAVSGVGRPAGHLLAVFGHRQAELGGYDAGETDAVLRGRIGEVLAAKLALVGDLVVVSGLNLGSETLAAEAAIEIGIPLVVVQPFPGIDQRWPTASRQRYEGLVAAAREVVVLEKKAPSSKATFAAALARRDAWLARNVDEAILVWDESDATLGKLCRTLEEHLGDDVWILHP